MLIVDDSRTAIMLPQSVLDKMGFTNTAMMSADNYKNLKVILHSSMSNPSNQQKAVQSGANRFVPKFDPDSLSEEIFNMVETS